MTLTLDEAIACVPHWAGVSFLKAICRHVQVGISKLDFDFREYADKFFGRAM